MKKKFLCIIPARGGSKRIPRKNIKLFCGKPLIAHTILHAQKCDFIDRIIVDTDSPQIAKAAIAFGAEVPFLRPPELARDDSKVIDAILHLLYTLKQREKYVPTHVAVLQTTSPLREVKDIYDCWDLLQKTDADSAVTVCPTHDMILHLNDDQTLVFGNHPKLRVSHLKWPPAYKLNGMVYMYHVPALLREKSIIARNTAGVVTPFWRSADLDTPEHFVLAELLYKNRRRLAKRINGKRNE